MAKSYSWEDFLNEKESDEVRMEPHLDYTVAEAKKAKVEDEPPSDAAESDFDLGQDYKKMLDFLRGKPTVKTPVVPPKEAPKGWFIVDEVSKVFWSRDHWSQNPQEMPQAIFESEHEAATMAKYVGGILIPAEELL